MGIMLWYNYWNRDGTGELPLPCLEWGPGTWEGRGGAQLMTSWAGRKPGLHLSDFNE